MTIPPRISPAGLYPRPLMNAGGVFVLKATLALMIWSVLLMMLMDHRTRAQDESTKLELETLRGHIRSLALASRSNQKREVELAEATSAHEESLPLEQLLSGLLAAAPGDPEQPTLQSQVTAAAVHPKPPPAAPPGPMMPAVAPAQPEQQAAEAPTQVHLRPSLVTPGAASNLPALTKLPVSPSAGQPEEVEAWRDSRPSRSSRESAPRRKLLGFYEVGTTAAGVGCYSFSGATTEVDLNSDNCRGATNMVCTGCFVATADSNNKNLEVVRCSSAKYKVGSAMSAHVVELVFINADTDSTLTIKACADPTCATPVSSYTMNGGDSVVGYCYASGSDQIYFPTAAFQNANTYNFNGKTLLDLGEVTTADINGGTINDVDITVGSSKTLDIQGSTFNLDDGSIPANKISPGIFTTGGTYSFTGSTVTGFGTITSIDIDGGTITGTDITIGSGVTLDLSNGATTFKAASVPANAVYGGTTFTTGGTYSFSGSTISQLGTVQDATFTGGSFSGVSISNSDVVIPSGKSLNVQGATLYFDGSAIAASKIGPGTFGAGGSYSFAGSTVSDLGTVTTIDINGGTIDGTNVGATTQGSGKFTTLEATSTFKTTGNYAFQSAVDAQVTINYQRGIIIAKATMLIDVVDTIVASNSYVTLTSTVIGSIQPCASGTSVLVGITTTNGGFTSVARNIGSTDCTSTYRLHFLVLP